MTVRFQSLTHELAAGESTPARDRTPVAVRVKEVTARSAGLASAALEGVAERTAVNAGFVHLLEAEFAAVAGTWGDRSEIAGIHIV